MILPRIVVCNRNLLKLSVTQSKWFSIKFNEQILLNRRMEAKIIARPDPALMKIDTPEFKSIFTQELHDLLELFKKYDHEIRVAGGAVRDILMGLCPHDVDFATTATPTEMKDMFSKEKVRMVNMNGEKHGTITPRINNKQNFEITTLRIDVVTDGRHAEVMHTKDWLLDANRRDLTINSMFLGLDGTIYDYFYGYEDLQKRKIAFVGDPDVRIKEDYLRILRYFRFYGRIAKNENNHDEETLKKIAENIHGLERISGERIWAETKKILTGNFAKDLILRLVEAGAAKYIGLPENPNIEEFKTTWVNMDRINSAVGAHQPITAMSAFLNNEEDAINLNARLKFTVFERELSYFLAKNRKLSESIDDLLPYQQMCLQTLGSIKLKKEHVLELLKYLGKVDLYNSLKAWTCPPFPVSGNDVKDNGCPGGPIMGNVMNKLKYHWGLSGFTATKEELLTHLPAIFEDLNIQDGKIVKKMKHSE